MKKISLSLAALALASISSVAMAQSAVTLYGVADVSVGRENKGDKIGLISSGAMNNGSSLIGLTGSEDLGNGSSIGFNFETELSLQDGSVGGSTFWSRHANLSFSGNWGTVKVGRQTTPSDMAVDAYELTGNANYSIVAAAYESAGTGSYLDNAIAYVSPTFSGVTLIAATVLKNNSGLSKNIYDLALVYEQGSLSAGLSVNKIPNKKTQYQVGAKYNLGNFIFGASYNNVDNRRGVGIGAGAEFGAFSLMLDVNRYLRNNGAKKFTNALIEGKYALSKRTFVYAVARRFENNNGYGVGIRHSF